MSTTRTLFDAVSNADLLLEVKRLAANERQATAQLIACLMELDARGLYLAEGCSSLFTYCTQVLHLSEHAAYGRIEAARAARRFPSILELLTSGELTLTAVGLLAPHLTADNHRHVLDSARHKSKREVEQLVATLHPRPDVPSAVRKLPTPASARRAPLVTAERQPVAISVVADGPKPPAASIRPAIVAPLAPERFKVQFTVSRATHDKLRQVQDLLRHQIPNGDPAAVFDRALTVLLEQLEKTKFAAAVRPRTGACSSSHNRHVPAAVKRAVWKRDGSRCAFVGAEGRCAETGFLEFHHVVPYAAGGETSIENLQLRCRAHNAFEAECVFGSQPLPQGQRERFGNEHSVQTE